LKDKKKRFTCGEVKVCQNFEFYVEDLASKEKMVLLLFVEVYWLLFAENSLFS
jgi:hypothetical protein